MPSSDIPEAGKAKGHITSSHAQHPGLVSNSLTKNALARSLETESTKIAVSWNPQSSGNKKFSNPASPRAATLKNFDWLTTPPPKDLTPFQHFIIHDVAWHSSPLGPIEFWPHWLKSMVMLVMSDPNPAVIYVDNNEGVEIAIVYNETYPALIGSKVRKDIGM